MAWVEMWSVEMGRRSSIKTSKAKTLKPGEGHARAQRPGPKGAQSGILALQHAAGNRAVGQALRPDSGKGKPLDPETRARMEQSFSTDFGDVRLHKDSTARAASSILGAEAFTQGDNIYLSAAAPAPDSVEGKKLLAHELAHVEQQRHAGAADGERIGQPGDSFEAEADRASAAATAGRSAQVITSSAPPAIQCQPEKSKSKGVDRAEVERWFRGFLQRVQEAHPGQSLTTIPVVRTALSILADAGGPQKQPLPGPRREVPRIESEMKRQQKLDSPVQPTLAAIVQEAIQQLPMTINPSTFARLKALPVSEKKPKGLEARIAGSAPATPNLPEELPSHTLQGRSKQEEDIYKSQVGETVIPLPASRLYDIIKGPDKKPRPPSQPEKEQGSEKEPAPAPGLSAPAADMSSFVENFDLGDLGLRIGTAMTEVVEGFEVGKSNLLSQHKVQLKILAGLVQPNPDIDIGIEIVGHTDTTGSEGVNQPLSDRRAAAVRDYLVKECGVSDVYIKSVTGRGEEEAKRPERAPKDYARNRRVEIILRQTARRKTK